MTSSTRSSPRHRRFYSAVALLLVIICAVLALLSFLPAPAQATADDSAAAQSALQYVLIAWNDLGMHCMNLAFKDLVVLPPFNTAWAQVVMRGDPPKIITDGVTVSYSVQDNTYSKGKTDFWDKLNPTDTNNIAGLVFGPYGFQAPLPDNVGLTGKRLSGDMDRATDHFVAPGIPLTPFLDSSPTSLNPYNLGNFIASISGTAVVTTTAVLPVSTEMHCDICHSDTGEATVGNITPTGVVETNILTLHDTLSPQPSGKPSLMSQRPVLCASCHGSNALGIPGDSTLHNLSLAMHGLHADEVENPGRVGGNVCYFCHPGPQTQCLRDVMYQHGMTCTDCHGTMTQVANPARNPWVDVPRCGNCHRAKFAENTGKRYRDSVGHGGLYCEACHNSTHAIVPSTQYDDNLQTVALQGYAGALGKCTVCHLTAPTGPGPHGLVVPAIPLFRAPRNGASVAVHRVSLSWYATLHTTSYNVQVRQDFENGQVVAYAKTTTPLYVTPRLTGKGTKYYWRVRSCDFNICSDWSKYRSFIVATALAAGDAPSGSRANLFPLLTAQFLK